MAISGYFEAGRFITPIEVPSGKIDRSQGDIHALGNPHFITGSLFESLRWPKLSAQTLSKLDAPNKSNYEKNTEGF